jgi:hypothetical protein
VSRQEPKTASRTRRMGSLGLALILALGLQAGARAAQAAAAAPWFALSSEVEPTNLPPQGQGQVYLVLSNLGDVPVNGSKSPVVITDTLPAGLVATGVESVTVAGAQVECEHATLITCKFSGVLNPYERLAIPVDVRVQEPPGTVTTLSDQLTAEGGGAARVTQSIALKVSPESTPFGVDHYELSPFNEDGTPATQAGAHPFELTTTLTLNQTTGRNPVALPKDLSFRLPPGLVGDPNAATQCTMTQFISLVLQTNLCPASSVVGVATITANEPKYVQTFSRTVPIFNLVPSQGEPARFGMIVIGKVPIVIDTSVRTGSNYEVVATVKDATETAGLLSSQVTFWGVPGDPRHDNARGWECVAGGEYAKEAGKPCPASSEVPQEPFLTMPTSCPASPASEPTTSTMEADSWAAPGAYLSAEYAWMSSTGTGLAPDGCNELPFTPSIAVAPEEHSASTPTGLLVNVAVPQKTTLEAGGLAEADVRDTTVTLPQGMQLSPAAANGLEACSESQIGYEGLNQATQTQEFSASRPSCPEASKVGLVRIKTPLLSHELEGELYLASPAPGGEAGRNPFNSLVSLYLVAEDPVSGVLVKLAGRGELNEQNLQVATTFSNAPQVPFEDLKLELFGGPKAALSTPAHCGIYGTEAVFTPWSATGPVALNSPASESEITGGPDAGACPSSPLPFHPGFVAQATNTNGGAYTNFELELSRPDGDQALSAVAMHLPPGNAAMLSSITQCSEAQAQSDSCPTESLIGETTAIAGLGPEPFVQNGGKVYITGPYGGAPFGLEIVTPADAGPFDLGYVTVRSRLYISPENASVTIVSEALPTQLRGIPLQLKRVLVDINREDFEFNPTNCGSMKIEGTITGAEGASAAVSSPYRVTNCQSLPFAPTLTATTSGRASKADGTKFAVKVTSKGLGQANIAKVDLQLPTALPARLSTLQKACTEREFDANPASCPEGSDIGAATIHTPVLKSALAGPAYLVSHGNAAFPDVEFVLQGEGITLVLDGKTQIKSGVTYSKFESAPDAPFTTFETVLPAGPHSALTANVPANDHYSLCGQRLSMPTKITGQNGSVIERDTKIAVQGCAAVKAVKGKKLTNTQKLARAQAACRRRYAHANAKRLACERQARRRYPLGNKASMPRRHRA